MRTAKKTLCLVLVVAMMLSLGVFSASADVKFTDAEDIQFAEAAEVLATIGVIEGFPEGDFRPAEKLTRAQGAAITARLMDWQEVPAITTFSDVPEWAHPYVAFCESNGIVAGYGDGTFGPDDELTGAQFAKMLLGALGFDPEAEKMQNVGTEWIVRVAQFARQNDLDDGIDNFPWNEAVSREQAAQMALNAIKATMVEYTTSGSAVAGTANASYMTDTKAFARRISDRTLTTGNYTVELGEYYFKDLRWDADTDAFIREGGKWSFKNKEIGFYPDDYTLCYTAPVKVSAVYADLGLTSKVEDVSRYIDGAAASEVPVIDRTGNTELGGNSVVTEIYYDEAEDYVRIIEIGTYAGKVDVVKTETASRDASVTLDKLTGPGTDKDYDTADFAKGDWVTYTISFKDEPEDGEIQSMEKATEVSGKLVSLQAGLRDTNKGYIKLDDTTYNKNKSAKIAGEDGKIGTEIKIYIDKFNNVVEAGLKVSDKYAIVAGLADANQVNVDNARVNILYDDATTKKGEVINTTELKKNGKDVDATNGLLGFLDTDSLLDVIDNLGDSLKDGQISLFDIVAYDKNDDGFELMYKAEDVDEDYLPFYDGVLTDGFVVDKDNYLVKYGKATMEAGDEIYTIDGDTTFVVMVVDDAEDGDGSVSYSAYEGIGEVPNIKFIDDIDEDKKETVVTVKADTDDLAELVFIFAPKSRVEVESDSSDDLIFIKGDSEIDKTFEGGKSYYEYDAIVDGEETTVKSAKQFKVWTLVSGVKYNADGFIDDVDNSASSLGVDDEDVAYYGEAAGLSYNKSTLKFGYIDEDDATVAETYVVDNDVDVYVWDAKDNLTVGGTEIIEDMELANVWFAYNDDDVITTLYIQEIDPSNSDHAINFCYLVQNNPDLDLYIVSNTGKVARWIVYRSDSGNDNTWVEANNGYYSEADGYGPFNVLDASNSMWVYKVELLDASGNVLATSNIIEGSNA